MQAPLLQQVSCCSVVNSVTLNLEWLKCGLQHHNKTKSVFDSFSNKHLRGYKQEAKMSSCGVGRGRGWLNLSKSAEPPKPMGLSKPPMNTPSPAPQLSSEYDELVDRIKELSTNDDGIMFNKKMKYIQSYWTQDCTRQKEVEDSFENLYKACLHDNELAVKLVRLMSARSFISQKIHECDLRQQFLQHLQRDFDNSNQLQTTNPVFFRNCVQMIGDFYYKARLSNGEPYVFLAVPFVACLELLLNSKTLPDLMLLTSQLFLNGSTLKTLLPEEMAKLGITIRTALVVETQLSKDVKLWLLLALDLFSARFGVLPAEIYKYYESQLGSVAMINFQRPHDALSIQTIHTSKILDSYQSNVNVLQISTSPTEPPQNDIQATHYSNPAEYNGVQQKSFVKDTSQKNKEKTGRPILGVGARFVKSKANEDNGSWNSKQNSSAGRTHSKKHPPSVKSNKGWEHDDRFENDYN
ncbi:hypothetical protein Zmor_021549 [Zophobas morio]|uniref:Uncharacterized protein n=2 Tax=Zophobas morio TaxID=2755281 RepID=A0AA38I9J8_9CUCU|nr:hypothetical protein Zmor_021549 [Zophobas morio]